MEIIPSQPPEDRLAPVQSILPYLVEREPKRAPDIITDFFRRQRMAEGQPEPPHEFDPELRRTLAQLIMSGLSGDELAAGVRQLVGMETNEEMETPDEPA